MGLLGIHHSVAHKGKPCGHWYQDLKIQEDETFGFYPLPLSFLLA